MPEAPPPGPLPKTIFFRVPVRGGFPCGSGVHERRETTETATGPPHRQVAAAQSAAVTTTNSQGTAPTLQAEPTPKNRATQTPAALRERGSGGDALLSEKRPLPRSSPMPAGRGGSVSHRDHNHFTRNRPHLAGGTNSEEPHNTNASRSSGEGVWGRGASLREAASPPESPLNISLPPECRGWRGR